MYRGLLLQELLEGEVLEELRSYGIDSNQEELTNEEYDNAMIELQNR